MKLPRDWKHRLLAHEVTISYDSPPPEGDPFQIVSGEGIVMLSAPHGARSFRNNEIEVWHEEDEYTAAFCLLLHELLNVHAIYLRHRSDRFDPNYQPVNAYKEKLGRYIAEHQIAFVLDLHGASLKSKYLSSQQLVDLGAAGSPPKSISPILFDQIREIIECHLGPGATDRKEKRGFNADEKDRTITNYLYNGGNVKALQIEMKPQIRVLKRLESASLYKSCGKFQAKPTQIEHMLLALVESIELLRQQE